MTLAFSNLFSLNIKKNAVHLLILILVFLSVLFLYKNGNLESLELYAYDQLVQRYPAESTNPPITIITVTEDDFRRLKRWSISDELLAEILTQLLEYKARVIGIDIYRDFPVPPGHKKLESVFTLNQNIIVPMKFGDEKLKGFDPPPALLNTEQVGLSDVFPDRDEIVRRGLLFLDDGQTILYSFPLRVALLYLQQQGITPQRDTKNPSHIRLGSNTIKPFQSNDGGYVDADAGGYQFLLDFCKPPKTIPRYDLRQFRSGNAQIEDFKDKIVLIGTVAASHKDNVLTLCGRGTETEQRVSGVLLHAAITDQFLRIAQDGQAVLEPIPDWQEIMWVLLWTLLGGIISQRQLPILPLLLVWAGGLIVLYAVTDRLFANGIWLISSTPAIAWLLSSILTTVYKATQEKRERSQLMSLFSKHVAPEIAEEIWQQHEQFFTEGRPRPQKTTATVMFTDLQNFTALSEKLAPEELYDWLNEYLIAMTPLVSSHRGVVIRFIGDAIFSGFGIPVPRKSEIEIHQDAINAVRCAVAMNRKLIQLNKKWNQQGLPMVGMRIGLHTGSLVTGSIGDRNRLEYTIHGDTVNTAARLEAFDKIQFTPDFFSHPCRIFIGGKTRHYLGNQFLVEIIGNIELRGKKQTVSIYRVIEENKSGITEI
jgi:adenylate cyclase